eukprot:9622251-Lingulodinium_polyedra.AAC.1
MAPGRRGVLPMRMGALSSPGPKGRGRLRLPSSRAPLGGPTRPPRSQARPFASSAGAQRRPGI